MSLDQLSFDEVMTTVDAATSDWEKSVIDRAILHAADTGRPFSMNDARDLLPELTSNNKIGPRFGVLERRGRIRKVEGQFVWSSKSTTRHRIQVWVKV